MKKLFLLLLVFIFTSSFTPLYEVILLGQSKVKREVPVKGTTGVPIFRSPNYSPVYICIYGNVLSIDWKKSIGTVFVQILNLYLQPIITQYFIDNKSEIWLLFLIAHSKR